MKGYAEKGKYEVVSPLGESTQEVRQLATRLDTLEGKTICEVYNGGFRGDRTFPLIRKLLKKRYPSIKFIPYTEIPESSIHAIDNVLKMLPDVFRQKGCDAVISGNAG